jgi:DNA-binding transcriptional MerR regulator
MITKIAIPKKLYRIGEIVAHTPFTRQTIHNYTVMGLIQECGWTQGGHRLYDESVFERLSLIMNLRSNKTLAQIRKILAFEDNDSDDNTKKAAAAS